MHEGRRKEEGGKGKEEEKKKRKVKKKSHSGLEPAPFYSKFGSLTGGWWRKLVLEASY